MARHHPKRLRELRPAIQQDLGHELLRVQLGLMPNNFKAMPTVGAGTYDIRLSDPDGIARLMYVAKFRNTIYILHVFEKKTQRTSQQDIEKAKKRYKEAKMGKSVFYDIADTPEEAANLTARSLLMIALEERIKEKGWTQSEAAEILHVNQPRVSDLMNGKLHKFSLDALVNMLPAVGLTFEVRPMDGPSRSVATVTPPARPQKAANDKREKRQPVKATTKKGSGSKVAAGHKKAVART
jgi:phage-related protein/predicted XRE-type DNA-binding protein